MHSATTIWSHNKIHCIVRPECKTCRLRNSKQTETIVKKRSSHSGQQSLCLNMWVMLTINGYSCHFQPSCVPLSSPLPTQAAHPLGQMCLHSIHDLTLTADPSYLTTPEHAACLSPLQGECLPSVPLLISTSTPFSHCPHHGPLLKQLDTQLSRTSCAHSV